MPDGMQTGTGASITLYPEQLEDWLFWYARPGVQEPDRTCHIWQDGIGSTGSSRAWGEQQRGVLRYQRLLPGLCRHCQRAGA